MYIEKLKLINVRTFVKNELNFLHPDTKFPSHLKPSRTTPGTIPKPKLPNVNLLLGDNGSGKSTVLQAIALASLGPAARDAQLPLRKFVRFQQPHNPDDPGLMHRAVIEAELLLHPEDYGAGERLRPVSNFIRKGELERFEYTDRTLTGETEKEPSPLWRPIFESKNEAFFCVAYGATRRVEAGESTERGGSPKTSFIRGQRVQSIFQDSFALFPPIYWLPQVKTEDPEKYAQVVQLLNQVLKHGKFRFTGKIKEQEYLFDCGGSPIPYRSLSDGFRSFIAWVADLLYHICYGCERGKPLTEIPGVILVDEIDLHLHPKWQMQVIRTVAKAMPRMQFIFTSHSPLVTGSLEWMNIITLQTDANTNRTTVNRLQQGVHGLGADQILLSRFFGLKTTQAPEKVGRLTKITKRIRQGDTDAPLELIREMSVGTEETQ